MSWECKKCGSCCRFLKCTMLEGSLCKIYKDRPDVCRVEKMFDSYYSKLMSRNRYEELCSKTCETLRLITKED